MGGGRIFHFKKSDISWFPKLTRTNKGCVGPEFLKLRSSDKDQDVAKPEPEQAACRTGTMNEGRLQGGFTVQCTRGSSGFSVCIII